MLDHDQSDDLFVTFWISLRRDTLTKHHRKLLRQRCAGSREACRNLHYHILPGHCVVGPFYNYHLHGYAILVCPDERITGGEVVRRKLWRALQRKRSKTRFCQEHAVHWRIPCRLDSPLVVNYAYSSNQIAMHYVANFFFPLQGVLNVLIYSNALQTFRARTANLTRAIGGSIQSSVSSAAVIPRQELKTTKSSEATADGRMASSLENTEMFNAE